MPLHLLPNLLGNHEDHRNFFPPTIDLLMPSLDGLIAENEKNGRAFLKRFSLKMPLQKFRVSLLNEHTRAEDIKEFLPYLRDENWGLISDAGLPCIADPGFALVQQCYQLQIPVFAHIGPSSIMLGIMLAGLPCQRFSFQGYISRGEEGKKKDLIFWEQHSKKEKSTQIFIETPYRNGMTLQSCLSFLSPNTQLSVVWDLTLPSQGQISKTILNWKKFELPEIDKKPAVFLFYASD